MKDRRRSFKQVEISVLKPLSKKVKTPISTDLEWNVNTSDLTSILEMSTQKKMTDDPNRGFIIIGEIIAKSLHYDQIARGR